MKPKAKPSSAKKRPQRSAGAPRHKSKRGSGKQNGSRSQPGKAGIDNEEDEREVDEEDMAFFGENQGYANFLTALDTQQLVTTKKDKQKRKEEIRALKALQKSSAPPSRPNGNGGSDHDDEEDDDDDFARDIHAATIDAGDSSDDGGDDSGDEIHQELLGDGDVTVHGAENEDDEDDDDDDSEVNEDQDDLDDSDNWDELSADDEFDGPVPQGSRKERKRDARRSTDDDALEDRPRLLNAGLSDDEQDDIVASNRLPIKLSNGRLVAPKVRVDEHPPSEDDDEEPADVEMETVDTEASTREAKEPQPELTGRAYVIAKSEQMAAIAQQVLEEPEEHIAKLSKLLPLLNDRQPKVQKLAVLSLLSIFKDIIPGYRINPLTDSQMSEKLSKDVRKLRNFEQGLIKSYQQYLKTLEKIFSASLPKVDKKAQASDAVSETHISYLCLSAMATLLLTHVHFNFRLNLLDMLVQQVTSPFTALQQVSLDTMRELFQTDELGEPTTEAVKLIAKHIKTLSYAHVPASVVDTFLYLRLKDELTLEDLRRQSRKNGKDDKKSGKASKKDRPYISKKQRKVIKREAEVEEEMREAEAVHTLAERRKHHTATLEHVFLTYVRVLKNAPRSQLVAPVLEGLCRYAHLISVEFFASLFEVFKTILSDTATSLRSKLMCVVTAVEVVSGQGESLNLDLELFYKSAYQLIAELATDCSWETRRTVVVPLGEDDSDNDDDDDDGDGAGDAHNGRHAASQQTDVLAQVQAATSQRKKRSPKDIESNLQLGLRAVDLLFCRRRSPPAARAAAFILRLCSVTTCAPPHGILSILVLVRTMLLKYPTAKTVLYPSSERPSSGAYNPLIDDPALAHPLSGTPWELVVLQRHWHADVRTMAAYLVKEAGTSDDDNGNEEASTRSALPLLALGVGIRTWRDVWAQWEWREASRFKPGIKEPREFRRASATQPDSSVSPDAQPDAAQSTRTNGNSNGKRKAYGKQHHQQRRPYANKRQRH
ncbi:hypothetical protein RI367_001171 [Sorochytrium milnesiophthora]